MSRRRQRLVNSWLIHAAALLLTVLILAPVIWMGLMSVSSTNDLTTVPLHWIPAEWDFSRYVKLLTIAENTTGAAFTASLRNSMVVAGLGAILALVIGIPAAWAVSRMPRRFSWMLHVSVATYMLPPVALVVPMYFALSGMGALNSVFSLALIYLSILAPFTAWLLKSNFDNVPFEIEQAAMMDGANLWQIMRNVTLPLAAPGLTTAGLFAFLLAWDEFFYALLFTSDQRAKTLTVAIADLAGGRIADYGLIAAAGIIAALPPVIIGFGLQKALISGLTTGGVKDEPQGNITAEGVIAIDREMSRQHDDALASYAAATELAARMADALRSRKRAFLLGMGGSHAVNRMAEVEYRALGIQAIAVSLSEQLYSPLDLNDSVVIVTSQSGESAEVHRILASLSGHPAAYGMTLEPSSTLGRMLPSLIGAGGTEHAFAATRSLMITLALHLGVLAALGRDASPALEILRTRARLDVTEAVKLLKPCRAIVYSGRGLRGLAEAAALSTMELARMPAYALEGGQFRHGPLEILRPDLGAVHFCADEPAASLVGGLARDTVAGGSPTLVFDTSGSDEVRGDLILRFPKASGIAAILSMLPTAQRLAIGIAGQRVSDVGVPLRTTKITRTE